MKNRQDSFQSAHTDGTDHAYPVVFPPRRCQANTLDRIHIRITLSVACALVLIVMHPSMSAYGTQAGPNCAKPRSYQLWVRNVGDTSWWDTHWDSVDDGTTVDIYLNCPVYARGLDFKIFPINDSYVSWYGTDWSGSYEYCTLRNPAASWSNSPTSTSTDYLAVLATYTFPNAPGSYSRTGTHNGILGYYGTCGNNCGGHCAIPGVTFNVTVHLIQVQFSETSANSGFDPGNEYFPRWLVVRKDSTNTCIVTVTPSSAASHVFFTFSTGNIASVSPSPLTLSPQTITVSGLAKGHTIMTARAGNSSGEDCAFLDICVRNKKTVYNDSHFISDSATPSPHSTGRDGNSLSDLRSTLNTVWNVQANIYFEVGEQDVVDSQALDSDYGPYIEVGGASDEYNNVKQFVTGGPPDVFFVWNAVWWDDNEQKYVDINGCADSHILLPDDNRVYDFAHEFGHVFGLSYPIFADYNTPGKENQLMYYASPPDGYKVMHYQVDVANTD